MKEKLFIFGLGSLTGSKLAKIAETKYEIIGSYNTRIEEKNSFDSTQLDICDYQKVKDILISKNPDYVVNASALNNVDYCEKNPTLAKETNHLAVRNISKICDENGIKLVQLSTDSVFNGQKTLPYDETDKENPINVYGQTKHLSELEVSKNPNNLVVRASVLYGWLSKDFSSQPTSSMKQFNFGLWLIYALKKNEIIKVITDELSTPIIADDFAKSIMHLILKNHSGVFHSAPKITISRYDFSKKFAKALGLNHELIKPTTNKELGRNVKTALNKCLNSVKLESTGFKFLNLEESFELMKKQMNS